MSLCGTLGREAAFDKVPAFRHYVVLVRYTSDKVRASTHGSAAAQFLDQQTFQSVAGKLDQTL